VSVLVSTVSSGSDGVRVSASARVSVSAGASVMLVLLLAAISAGVDCVSQVRYSHP
jgi:hypothetical protein